MNSVAIGYQLVFESKALVTLVSSVADGAPLLSPILSSYFSDLLIFGLPPLWLPKALFFRSSLWPSLQTAYRSDFRSVRMSVKLPPLRKGKSFRSPTLQTRKGFRAPPLRKGKASDPRRCRRGKASEPCHCGRKCSSVLRSARLLGVSVV